MRRTDRTAMLFRDTVRYGGTYERPRRTPRRKSSSADAAHETVTVGVDLGARKCHICVVDAKGEVVKEEAITTSPTAFKDYFKKLPTATVVAIEVGPHFRDG